jgi:putative ABC transport system permease protein
VLGDVRHALRIFHKAPFWTLSVVGTLALGIGTTTAMFSVGNTVLLTPLPYPEPDRLVMLWGRNPQKGLEQQRVTMADFSDWRARSHVFEKMGYSFLWPGSRSRIVRTSAPQEVPSALVSSTWLSALGVRPALGRIFRPEEDHMGAHLVAMISDRFWQQQFGRDPRALGRALTIDNFTLKDYQVVGVMPAGLEFPRGTDLWLSLGAAQFEPPAPGAGQRCCDWLEVIARLRRGVSVEQARAELDGIQSSILAEHGPADVNPAVGVVPLARHLTGAVRRAILILMAAVGCVLLIACVNAANLLLARSLLRKREIEMRSALGATRLRIVGQLLTESLMLSMAAGLAGLVLASWLLPALKAIAPNVPRLNEVRADTAFLAICAATAVLTGIVFGLAPALQWTRSGFVHGQAGAGGQGRRLRDILVIAEVALSTVLLIGAALLLRSLERLNTVDPGFRPGGVLTAHLDMSSVMYSTSAKPGPNRPQVSFRRLIEKMRNAPGVVAAGGANRLPLAGIVEGQGDAVVTDDSPSVGRLHGSSRAVTPDYFTVMGMPLLRGRAFTEADTDESELVVIVDEAVARRYWPGRDPLGQRMATVNTRFPSAPRHWMKVVGVVAPVRSDGLDTVSLPQFYVPYFDGEWRSPYMVVRTAGDPAAFGATLRQLVNATDGNAVVTEVRPMDALVSASTALLRFRTLLLGAFSALALLLAAAGIYAVMAYTVEQRTSEIGVRMALGARTLDIFRMVLGRGVILAVVGLAIGLVAALALRGLIAALLFETSASDPLALSLVAVLLLLTALGACYVPSLKAARVDPLVALRHDG